MKGACYVERGAQLPEWNRPHAIVPTLRMGNLLPSPRGRRAGDEGNPRSSPPPIHPSMPTLRDDMPPKNVTRSHDLLQGAMLSPLRREHAKA
jgi:hypothetical protein